MENLKEFTCRYYLSAGECDPHGEMPLPLLVSRVIDVATRHANSWGVGYERLVRDNHAWVLSRVTVELDRYPRVNEDYELTTWIEDYNRHYSQRNMQVRLADGTVLGYVRTIWMVIDLTERKAVDMSQLVYIARNVNDRPCPIERQGHLRPVTAPTRSVAHTFGYVECDANRHVNTVRYMEMLLNCFTLEHYDSHRIARLEIAFANEARYGQEVTINIDESDNANTLMSVDSSSANHVRCRIVWSPR